MITSIRHLAFRCLNKLTEASSRAKWGVMDPSTEQQIQEEQLS